jgi:hypothetical protein
VHLTTPAKNGHIVDLNHRSMVELFSQQQTDAHADEGTLFPYQISVQGICSKVVRLEQ